LPNGTFYGRLVQFEVILVHIFFPVLVCCAEKNLATLMSPMLLDAENGDVCDDGAVVTAALLRNNVVNQVAEFRNVDKTSENVEFIWHLSTGPLRG
jgi:hypothetical protein